MIFVILFDVGICNSGCSQISFILFGIIKEQPVIKIIVFFVAEYTVGERFPKIFRI